MTLEQAHQLLVQVVTELKPLSRSPEGVLGARLAGALVQRGHGDLHRQFHFDKLGQFISERCQPPLVVRRAPPLLDILIDLADADTSVAPGTSPDVVPPKKPGRIEPSIWRAVLSPDSPQTYIDTTGRPVVGKIPPGTDGYKRVERMSLEDQVAVLDGIREQVGAAVKNPQVCQAILDSLDAAKGSEAPILEFSKTMSALYWFSNLWNSARIKAVLEFVSHSTGVTPGESTSGTTSARSFATVSPRYRVPTAHPVERSVSDPLEGLRDAVVEAVERMSLRDLLDLKLPVEATRLARIKT